MDKHPKMRAKKRFRDDEKGSTTEEPVPKWAKTEENCIWKKPGPAVTMPAVRAQRVSEPTEVNSVTTHRRDEAFNSINRSLTGDLGIKQDNADWVLFPLYPSVQTSMVQTTDNALSSFNAVSQVFSVKDTPQSFNWNLYSEAPFPVINHQPINEAYFPKVTHQPISAASVINREPISEASVQINTEGLNFSQPPSGAGRLKPLCTGVEL